MQVSAQLKTFLVIVRQCFEFPLPILSFLKLSRVSDPPLLKNIFPSQGFSTAGWIVNSRLGRTCLSSKTDQKLGKMYITIKLFF